MPQNDVAVPLHQSLKGQRMRIQALPSGPLRSYLIRLGLNVGDHIECLERLPGGTVVVEKNRQQIAIGYRLAKQILVLSVGG